jgi:hypothetical protein
VIGIGIGAQVQQPASAAAAGLSAGLSGVLTRRQARRSRPLQLVEEGGVTLILDSDDEAGRDL